MGPKTFNSFPIVFHFMTLVKGLSNINSRPTRDDFSIFSSFYFPHQSSSGFPLGNVLLTMLKAEETISPVLFPNHLLGHNKIRTQKDIPQTNTLDSGIRVLGGNRSVPLPNSGSLLLDPSEKFPMMSEKRDGAKNWLLLNVIERRRESQTAAFNREAKSQRDRPNRCCCYY